VHFKATYNPQTHFFNVIEDDSHSYTLAFDPNTKVWTATGGQEPAIPVDQLALLVQKSFGVFV
jgi:hypothetical protein